MYSIIAAKSKNGVIGNNGKIPWFITGEQTRFKNITMNGVVVMGRVTFEEIFKKLNVPLPGRTNIVITKKNNREWQEIAEKLESKTLFIVDSFENALTLIQEKFPQKEIFFAGGESIYEKALPLVQRIYLTQIEAEFSGDKFFPIFDSNQFITVDEQHFSAEHSYTCYTLKRRS